MMAAGVCGNTGEVMSQHFLAFHSGSTVRRSAKRTYNNQGTSQSLVTILRLDAKTIYFTPSSRRRGLFLDAPDGQQNLKAFRRSQPLNDVGLCRRHRRQDFVTLSVFSHICPSAPFLLSQCPPLNCSKSMQKLQLLNPVIVERGMQLHVRS